MFSLIYAGTNGWVNNPDAGDLRRHRAHYDITVMLHLKLLASYEVLQPWCFIFRCQDYICITPGPYNIWELGAPSAVAVGELARGGWGWGGGYYITKVGPQHACRWDFPWGVSPHAKDILNSYNPNCFGFQKVTEIIIIRESHKTQSQFAHFSTESVKITSMWNESIGVLCKNKTLFDKMEIK